MVGNRGVVLCFRVMCMVEFLEVWEEIVFPLGELFCDDFSEIFGGRGDEMAGVMIGVMLEIPGELLIGDGGCGVVSDGRDFVGGGTSSVVTTLSPGAGAVTVTVCTTSVNITVWAGGQVPMTSGMIVVTPMTAHL